MLMRTDPFRELDRLTQHFFNVRPTTFPMDAYRAGDEFVVQFDLPGVNPDSVDVSVERNVLTVKAERPTVFPDGAQVIASERPAGSWSRQLFLGDNLDAEHIRADYEAGVLTLYIPVAEQAKPRRIAISSARTDRKEINA